MKRCFALLLALLLVGCGPQAVPPKPPADPDPAPSAPAEAAPDAHESALRQQIDRMYQEDKKGFPDIKDITAEALMRRLQADGDRTLLVDVREPKEQAVGMIPGAITFQAFEKDPEAYKGRPIVFYCTIGTRSGYATKKYAAKGFDATNLQGSVLSWAHAGGTFVTPDGKPTKRVDVYGERWNLVPEGYEGVW